MKRIMKTLMAIVVFALALGLWMPAADAEPRDIRYETELDYPPYKFWQNGFPTGFDLELTNLIFADKNYSLSYAATDWQQAYEKLKKGTLDTAGLMAVDKDRKKDILYSKPVTVTYTAVYANKWFKDKVTMETLKNYSVGVAENQYTEALLKKEAGINKYRTYRTVEAGLHALRNGEIALLFENQDVVDYLIVKQDLTGEIHKVLPNLYPEDVAYGVSKQDPWLVDFINHRIDAIQDSGTYEDLYQKYFFKHSEYYHHANRKRLIYFGTVALLLVSVTLLLLKLYINRLRKTIYGEREFSREVLDHTNLFIWAVNRDKATVRFNHYAEKVTGIPETEAVGTAYNGFKLLNDQYSELISLLDQAFNGQFVDNLEVHLAYNGQKQTKAFLFRTSVIFDLTGAPDVFVMTGVDIEERKQYENKLQASYQELEATYEQLAAAQEEQLRQFDELVTNQEKLRISEERFRLATLGSGAAIWDTHPSTGRYFISDRLYELLGYTREESTNTFSNWKVLVHPDDRDLMEQRRIDYLQGRTPVYECEYRVRKKDGEYLWIQARGKLQRDAEGKVEQFAGSMIDVTDQKLYELKLEESNKELEQICTELTATQAELKENYDRLLEHQEKLRRSEERYRLVTEASNGGTWEVDLVHNTWYYSPRWYELLGCPKEERSFNGSMKELVHADDAARFEQELEAVQMNRKELFECEYRLRHQNGSYRWFLGRGKALLDAKGTPYRMAGSIVDNHELKLYQERLQHLAYHDSLCDLPNRRCLLEEMETIFTQPGARGALCFIDVDNFKFVNDTLGHKIGDGILRDASSRLTSVTEHEGMLFRLGGDEFVILLKDVESRDQVIALVDRLLESFKAPFRIQDNELHISISVGVSFYPEDGASGEEILKNADVAMYAAKEEGKGKYIIFNPAFLQAFSERVNMEKYLRKALDRNEFRVFYQPQVHLRDGCIYGFEALIRWNSPERGMVSPLSFIKIAEDSRLIVPIGEWVLAQSCMFAKRLQDEGYGEYKMAVNISVVQLLEDDFVDSVLRILDKSGLNPEQLELEITESMIMESFHLVISKLELLKSKGIQIALDDFGTGYSSLGSLKNMPITTLKVDKSFIEQVPEQEDNRNLARTIVMIGRKLGMRVVAEGVETELQLQHVKRAKCDLVQGYLFSKPLPEPEALKLVRSGRKYPVKEDKLHSEDFV